MKILQTTNRSTKSFLIKEIVFGFGGGLGIFFSGLIWFISERVLSNLFMSDHLVHLNDESVTTIGFIVGFLLGSLHGVIYWNWAWIRKKWINATLFWASLALVVLLPGFAINLIEDGWKSVWHLPVLIIFFGYPLMGAGFGTFLGIWVHFLQKIFLNSPTKKLTPKGTS